MANRIQIRRDSEANWESINPVLADGEPGLNYDNNQVKYGDGESDWMTLTYSSTVGGNISWGDDVRGSITDVISEGFQTGNLIIDSSNGNPSASVNRDIRLISHGPGGGTSNPHEWAFDSTGNLTVPSESTISWGSTKGRITDTSNGLAGNLTISAGSGPSVNRDIKLISRSNGTTYEWTFDRDGELYLPQGGVISEVTVDNGIQNPSVGILLTPSPIPGTNPDMAVKIYPTFNDDDHIHITAGNPGTVDLFLGDDIQYVKLEADGGNIVISADDPVGIKWTFGTDGKLTLPKGGIIKEVPIDALTITVVPNTNEFSTTGVAQSPGGQWGDNITYPLGTPCRLTLVGATGDWVQYDGVILYTGNNDGNNIRLSTNSDVALAQYINITTGSFDSGTLTLLNVNINSVVVKSGSNEWTFGTDGRTTFPVATVPTHSYGVTGDHAGMLAFDASYIYYCTADYVDVSTAIWKRTEHGAGTW